MKIFLLKYRVLALILIFCFSLYSLNAETIKGKVQCAGKGLENVVVTDGYTFAMTKTDGSYSLELSPRASYVYISSPSGYTVPVENSVPKFYKPITCITNLEKVDFDLIKLKQSDKKHYFIAVGDPQVRNMKEIHQLDEILKFMKKDIADSQLAPAHLMVLGDVVFDTPNMNEPSKKSFSTINLPVYYAIGNHDHLLRKDVPASDDYDLVADMNYKLHYGPTYYSFNRGDVHYISLDNIYYKGGPRTEYDYTITQEQLDWIKRDLQFVPKSKTIVAMVHAPTKSRVKSEYNNSNELHVLFEGYKDVHIIAGHTHNNSVVSDNTGITCHIVGASCGGWWEGPVCTDGTYIGYKIFEINGTDVKWKYRSVECPDKQFSVSKPAPRNEILRPSEELLVNVWDWDKDWTVEWSEDGGKTFKSMKQCEESEYCPIAFKYYGLKADGIPAGRNFIASVKTDHIFTCIPSRQTKKVIIRVVNRFKEEFKEEVDL